MTRRGAGRSVRGVTRRDGPALPCRGTVTCLSARARGATAETLPLSAKPCFRASAVVGVDGPFSQRTRHGHLDRHKPPGCSPDALDEGLVWHASKRRLAG